MKENDTLEVLWGENVLQKEKENTVLKRFQLLNLFSIFHSKGKSKCSTPSH